MRKGFTLIELLVVISIIALLIAILLPAMGRVKAVARDTQCLSNLRGLGQSYQAHATDLKGKPFPIFNGDDHWTEIAEDYQSGTDLAFACPSAPQEDEGAGRSYGNSPNNRIGGRSHAWRFERDVFARINVGQIIGSYQINIWTQDWTQAVETRGSVFGLPRSKAWEQGFATGPSSDIPLLGDGIWHNSAPRDTDRAPAKEPDRTGSNLMGRYLLYRHANQGINLVFADGSARIIPLEQMWSIRWHRDFKTRETETVGYEP